MDANTRNWVITGIIAIIVIVLIGWAIAAKRAGSPVVGSSTSTTTGQTDTTAGSTSGSTNEPSVNPSSVSSSGASAVASGETVTTQDQPAGISVSIAQATLKNPSWIAIKDTNGRILGAGWFSTSGEHLSVPLLRATEAGQVYQAVIYVDDGDKQFDFHKDTLLTSSEGAPVSSTFRAQ